MIAKGKLHIWLLLPAIITLVVITIFPLIYAVNVSLRDYSLATGKQVHNFNNLKNVGYVLRDPEFYNSVGVIFKFSSLCLIIELSLGFGLALLFSQPNYKLEPIGMLIILPMAIAPAVIGLVFRWLYSNEVGIIGYMLESIGITPPSWSGDSTAALFSLVITDVWEWTPYVFLICMAGLKSIQEEVYEAANIDGASAWKRLRHITLPLMKPTIIIVFILRAIPALREFDKIFIMTDGGPGISTESTSMYIFRQFLWFNNLGTATAAALLLLICIIIISQVLFFYLRRHEKW